MCNKYEYKNSIFPAAMASLEKDGSTSTDVIPASLLKQLRAVAALISYDRITVQASMNLLEQQRRIHSIFHGNQETNMTSQLERLVNGRDQYANIYDIEDFPLQTDTDAPPQQSQSGVINAAREELVVK